MANLHKFTVQEALNTTSSGNFNQLDGSSGGLGGLAGATITAGSSADVENTKHLDISSGVHQLLIYSRGDIYFNFATSDEDVVANNSLILPGGILASVAVPLGIADAGDTIRFNFNSTSTATHTVRIVEV
jgi:hypothetical protein